MKKISLAIIGLLLCSCNNISISKPLYINKDKYYKLYYNDSLLYKETDYIYFDDGSLYTSKGDYFTFKLDNNNFIYNYDSHKIWGKILQDGLIITYNHTYNLTFEINATYCNASYLNLIEINI